MQKLEMHSSDALRAALLAAAVADGYPAAEAYRPALIQLSLLGADAASTDRWTRNYARLALRKLIRAGEQLKAEVPSC
jgi:hypothetical protein